MAAQSEQSETGKSSDIDIKEDASQEEEPGPSRIEANALKN